MATIGDMKKTVIFYINAPVAQGAGKKDVYSTTITTKGSLKKMGGSRTVEAGQELFMHRWELVTRFQEAINLQLEFNQKNIMPMIDGYQYHIDSWERVDGRPMYYRFLLSQQGHPS